MLDQGLADDIAWQRHDDRRCDCFDNDALIPLLASEENLKSVCGSVGFVPSSGVYQPDTDGSVGYAPDASLYEEDDVVSMSDMIFEDGMDKQLRSEGIRPMAKSEMMDSLNEIRSRVEFIDGYECLAEHTGEDIRSPDTKVYDDLDVMLASNEVDSIQNSAKQLLEEGMVPRQVVLVAGFVELLRYRFTPMLDNTKANRTILANHLRKWSDDRRRRFRDMRITDLVYAVSNAVEIYYVPDQVVLDAARIRGTQEAMRASEDWREITNPGLLSRFVNWQAPIVDLSLDQEIERAADRLRPTVFEQAAERVAETYANLTDLRDELEHEEGSDTIYDRQLLGFHWNQPWNPSRD
jgi:hypothetical protein